MAARLLLLFTLSIVSATVSSAETDLSQLAAAAAEDFEPLGDAELADARDELAKRVIAAERLLKPSTARGARWLEYLEWNGVQKQLAPGSKPDLAAAKRTLRRLSSGADGLDRSALQRAADAIEAYIGVAQYAPAAADRQGKSFGRAMQQLADQLADRQRLTTARGSFATERRLGLLAGLATAGRGEELLDAIHDEFREPNLLVEVEAPLLSQLVARSINDCTSLTDCILGTRISGTGATTGSLVVKTLPAADRARLRFELSGTTRSNTVGRNGPVAIRSTGNTQFTAAKVVELNDEAFRVSPASGAATTRSTTQSVSKVGGGIGTRLIEKIARQRVAQSKPQADAIAGQHATERIERRLDEQLNEQIASARRRYDAKFRKPLRQRRATPERLDYRTTSDALYVEAVQADDGQLAAWDAPPIDVVAPLRVRLHQTAINNLLDAYIGGATIRRDAIEEPTKIDVVAPPWLELKAEPLAPGEEFKPWEVRLRDERPVSVEALDGQLKVLVHAARIRTGDSTYDNWDLIATLEPERRDGKWVLVRQGPVDVLPTRFDPAEGRSLSSADVGLRNNLIDAINKPAGRMPETVKIDPVDLTSRNGPVDFLLMEAIEIQDGWLAAGWRVQ
ncbi:MAG: hypothetical protein AAF266_06355 [Planctomycetota bacterium]